MLKYDHYIECLDKFNLNTIYDIQTVTLHFWISQSQNLEGNVIQLKKIPNNHIPRKILDATNLMHFGNMSKIIQLIK